MNRQGNGRLTLGIVIGLVAGLGIAALWPHEQARAVATDRDAQFAMTTSQVSAIDGLEAVFVLDFLTGSLKGAVLHRNTGKFTNFYYRNLAKDFRINPKKEAHYCIVPGMAQLNAEGSVAPAPSVIYVGELTTGRIISYAFAAARDGGGEVHAPIEMVQGSDFPFREPDPAE